MCILIRMEILKSRGRKLSKVEIEIPDDRWFRGGLDFRPQDKQLCVVINKVTGIPMVGIYLENVSIDRYSSETSNYFFDVIEVMEFQIMQRSEAPGFLEMEDVDRWKPLGLPADVNKRILAEIEKWFEEDE